MTANNNNFYLDNLNKLVDQYNNTYHRSIDKKHVDTNYFDLTEDIDSIHKASNLKAGDRVRITKYKTIFSKGYTENCSR